MSRLLRVLLVEDNPADAELILRELRHAGFDPQWERVDTEQEYLAQLHPELDVVLSDYSMPQFSGQRALRLLQDSGMDLPFIIISGTIGEDLAVEAMRQGASDYLLKDRMARLGLSVTIALEKRRLRKESEVYFESMRQSEHKYRQLFENLAEAAFLIDCTSRRILDANLSAADLLGKSRTEIVGMDEAKLFAPELAAAVVGKLTGITEKTSRGQWLDAVVVTKDETMVPVQISVTPLVLYGRELVLAMMTDIAARKRQEDGIRESGEK